MIIVSVIVKQVIANKGSAGRMFIQRGWGNPTWLAVLFPVQFKKQIANTNITVRRTSTTLQPIFPVAHRARGSFSAEEFLFSPTVHILSRPTLFAGFTL